MGHPDRKVLRQRKKKEKLLERKSFKNYLDLTPYNAVGKLSKKDFEIKFK